MFSSYEPELFPGLIYRMMKPKIVLLIFVSGKIVLTGAKVREEIYQAFELICKYHPRTLEWDPTLITSVQIRCSQTSARPEQSLAMSSKRNGIL